MKGRLFLMCWEIIILGFFTYFILFELVQKTNLRKKISTNEKIALSIMYFVLFLLLNICMFCKVMNIKNNLVKYCSTEQKTYSLSALKEDTYFEIKDGNILVNEETKGFELLDGDKCTIKETNDSNAPQLVKTDYILKNKFYMLVLGQVEPSHYEIHIPKSNNKIL